VSCIFENIKINSNDCFNKAARKILTDNGAILLAIPVLIALLYYMRDLPKFVYMHERMKFCDDRVVNMVQNISQNRTKIFTSEPELFDETPP
jgi:hypothetical protein